MKLKDLDFEDKTNWLRTPDLDIFFEIFKDKRSNYVYDLNTALYIDVDDNRLKDYVCTHDMFWPLISYKLYNTTRLTWLLLKLNKVDAADVLDMKHSGDVIKYLPKGTATNIIGDINNMDQ